MAPCRQTCPAEIDIPHLHPSDPHRATMPARCSTIRERNPLLLACGRVCPHPCED
ncbi:MAG: hypothetical protein MZV70_20280 [Desulfobacterales bacterium]|nr:hypothetical protein [Desulfobacterales bacterium]